MANFLDYAVPGLNLVSGIFGAFGSNRARKRALEARQRAFTDYARWLSEQEAALQRNNAMALSGYAGGLNDSLEETGRSLGSAMAQAGVYNSSATAGALSNMGTGIAAAKAGYARDLGSRLADLQYSNRANLAQMQYGAAQDDVGYARDNFGGMVSGIASALQLMPGFGKSSGGTGMPAPVANPQAVNPIQSVIQQKTQNAFRNFGGVDSATSLFPVGPGAGGTGFMPIRPPAIPGYQGGFRPFFAR